MCFSSTASFTAAAVLLPLGLAATRLSQVRQRPQLLPLALMPVGFAFQQALEGMVWIQLNNPASAATELARPWAVAYLFFALAFWLAWMPWCALCCLGHQGARWQQRWIRGLLVLGVLMGLALWLPVLLDHERIAPTVVHGSIDYRSRLLGAGVIGHGLGSLLYAIPIAVPLLLTPSRRLRWLALLILVAFAIAQSLYLYAFSSVWCYFSALLSVLVVWILQEAPQPTPLAPP